LLPRYKILTPLFGGRLKFDPLRDGGLKFDPLRGGGFRLLFLCPFPP